MFTEEEMLWFKNLVQELRDINENLEKMNDHLGWLKLIYEDMPGD